jgi:hypothetical protein
VQGSEAGDTDDLAVGLQVHNLGTASQDLWMVAAALQPDLGDVETAQPSNFLQADKHQSRKTLL